MTWQIGIWMILVVAVSAGILLGVMALSSRMHAIDERLFELRLVELELTRTFKRTVANQATELEAIKMHLNELSAQHAQLLRELSHRGELTKIEDIAEIAVPATTVPHPEKS